MKPLTLANCLLQCQPVAVYDRSFHGSLYSDGQQTVNVKSQSVVNRSLVDLTTPLLDWLKISILSLLGLGSGSFILWVKAEAETCRLIPLADFQ